MVEIGCVAHFHYPYKDEVSFAKQNGFQILQIWYDRDGISVTSEGDSISEIKNINFPSIIHAVLDINEIEEHIPRLLKILIELGHKELIIHPVCKTETVNSDTIRRLSEKIRMVDEAFSEIKVKTYVENNSKLDSMFVSASEIKYLFEQNPNVGFLLDLAHIDSYQTLNEIVLAKFPDYLHIADKHFDVIHEHLPIGEGELDFGLIFSKYLKGYCGKVILEITQNKEVLVESKKLLEFALKHTRNYRDYI